MKILKFIGIGIAALVAVLLVIGLISSKDYNIHRDTVINAPVETVFKNVSTYENFKTWSPWQKLDSNMTSTIEGTDGTVGAKYSWKGNDNVGEGSMTITKLEENKSIEHLLSFIKPFESSCTTYMNLEAADGGTKVTWGMKGESGFVERIFMTLMGGMDKAVGKDYEKGLTQLKTVCESTPANPTYTISEIDWVEKNCLSHREVVKFQDMSGFFGGNFPKIFEAVAKAGAKPGIPLAIFYKYDEAAGNADVAAAIPYEGKKFSAKGFENLNLPAVKGYVMDYFGPYNDEMKKPYVAMDAKLKEMGKTNPKMVIEEYITDPMSEKDSTKWHTKVYFFVD